MKLKCLVVDDEPLARNLLKGYIEKLYPTLVIEGVCNSAIEAQNFLFKNHVDVLFMDIEMPNLSGMDFLKSLSNPPFTIITSAYSEFAVTSYELDNIVDYLIKPIAFNRFVKATNRVVCLLNKDENVAITKNVESTSHTGVPVLIEKKSDYIFFRQESKIIKVNHNGIRYIQSFGEYAKVYTEEGRIVSRLALSKILDNLPRERFIRIHRSYIVNLQFISHLEGNHVMIGDAAIPVSRGKKEELLSFIKANGYLD